MKKINKSIKNQRKRIIKESSRHELLKVVGRRFFQNHFGVHKEDIYEDFPLGDHIFDLIVYPRRNRKGASKLTILSMECGSLSCKNSKDCINYLKKIADMLDFVDMIIWVPYSIHLNPFADIMMSAGFRQLDKKGKVAFSTESLGLHKVIINIPINKNEQSLNNSGILNDKSIASLAFFKGETYEKLKTKGQKFLS